MRPNSRAATTSLRAEPIVPREPRPRLVRFGLRAPHRFGRAALRLEREILEPRAYLGLREHHVDLPREPLHDVPRRARRRIKHLHRFERNTCKALLAHGGHVARPR